MRPNRTIDIRDRTLARNIPRGRTLHLVDLENLAGGSSATSADVTGALAAYESVVRFGPADHRVVACAKPLWATAKASWPGALVRAVKGIDGADLQLLADGDARYVGRHYDRAVVASGDHIFVDLVIELDAAGVEVCVVSRRRSLSRRLALVAPVVWYLDDDWATLTISA